MKRKVKKFAGDEGSVVRTRTDDEIEADNKAGYGRYIPKTKEYTLDEVKDKLSGLFGGSRDESKFSDLKSVGGPERRARTIEEQIGRKAESKASEQDTEEKSNRGERAQTKMMPKGNYEYKGPMPDETPPKTNRNSDSGRSSSGGGGRSNAPKKNVGENAKPLPGVSKDKDKPKNLPGNPKDRSKPLAFKQEETTPSKYEDVTSKKDLGSQGSFKMNTNKPVTRYRKKEEDAPEVKIPKSNMDVEPEDMPKAASKALKDDTQYKTKYGDFSFQKGFKKDEDKKEKKTRTSADIRAGRYRSGGSVSSASSRGDGIAQRGKTRGKVC
jgi:hypothetical protein